MPYQVGVGNHEQFYNWTAFTNRYHMPYERSGGNGNFWYSFDFGNVHFTSMSTEHPYGENSPQAQWIKADLHKANANRANVPWVVVTGHRPMLCSDKNEWDAHQPGAPFQAAVEPLILEFNVDLLISGHMHCIERVHPSKNGTVVTLPDSNNIYTDPTAPVQLVIGSAGAMQEELFETPQPEWSAFRAANKKVAYGFGKFSAYNATHLSYNFSTIEGNVTDTFWIVKTH